METVVVKGPAWASTESESFSSLSNLQFPHP
jgi:hypothetical protein